MRYYMLFFRKKRKKKWLNFIKKQIEIYIKKSNSMPILIISYNNAIYVENITTQLNKLNIKPIIIDNASDDVNSLNLLYKIHSEEKAYVIFGKMNFGHMVGFMSPIYDCLPNFFGYSDPDIKFNDNMPISFLSDFKKLTEKYKIYKAGCALELNENIDQNMKVKIKIKKNTFSHPEKEYSIYEWESRYWNLKIDDDEFRIYSAPIDTTFAVYNKKYFYNNFYDAIRVAGEYSALHIPWYSDLELFTDEERLSYHNKSNKSSTWVK